jgi:hypothetical protein
VAATDGTGSRHFGQGSSLMLYPIWQPLPRPRYFPEDPKLDRLLDSYDPKIGYFRLPMFRRNARDLRKGLFGPKGLRDVPKDMGVRTFDLPDGWTLRLTYGERPDDWREAGDVVAEFIPPTMRKSGPISTRRAKGSGQEAPLHEGGALLATGEVHPAEHFAISERLDPWRACAKEADPEIRKALLAALGKPS